MKIPTEYQAKEIMPEVTGVPCPTARWPPQ